MYSMLQMTRGQGLRLPRGGLKWSVQSSQTFFKLGFKAPQALTSKTGKATIKELSKKQSQPFPTPPSSSQSTQSSQPPQQCPQMTDQQTQPAPQPTKIESPTVGKIHPGLVNPSNPHIPQMKASPRPVQPNIADQRAKWMAKVSPEMQKKAKQAAIKGGNSPSANPARMSPQHSSPSFSGAANQQFGGMPWNQPVASWQQPNQNLPNHPNHQNHQNHSNHQNHPNYANYPAYPNQHNQNQNPFQQAIKKPEPEPPIKGASTEDQRKSWMNRMQGSQQKKQAEWLKNIQAKQQAGKDLHAQKMQKIQQAQSASAGAAAAKPTQAVDMRPTKLPEPKPEEKTPERLAYLEAIKQLNTFQVLEPVPGRATSKSTKRDDPIIEETLACLEKTGLSREALKTIPVIQIAGSKGRGSTCGIVESILRCHGVKTGVLCSPHLFLTSERIRIDGQPLDEVEFTDLFWHIHGDLANVQPTPSYNKLMTVMAFHAFHRAKVEVIIVEVGHLGAGDATNIASHAETIGITSLGWEQSSNLSNSLRDIAWSKAAIMKPNANIYTSVTQTECCEVLAQKANQLGVPLHRVPAFTDYMEGNLNNKHLMNKANYTMRLNGSLAIQLAYDFLRRHHPEYVVGLDHNATHLTPGATRGIESYEQAGQFDFIRHDMFNVYLDSADTFESMMACRDWFHQRTRSNRQPKILLFNKVNEFNAKDLLTIIRSNLRFEEACFVPSPTYFEGDVLAEEEGNPMVWHGMEELQRAKRNAGNWRALCEENGKKDNSQLSISIHACFEYLLNKYGKQKYGMKNELDILVTGSRQLVAATLSCVRKMKAAHQWAPSH